MITEYAHLTGICVTKDHMDIYNLGRSPQLMLAFIIITPNTLGYKSALKTARKVHQYLVPTLPLQNHLQHFSQGQKLVVHPDQYTHHLYAFLLTIPSSRPLFLVSPPG